MPPTTPPPADIIRIVTLGRLGFEGRKSDGCEALLSQPKRLAVLLYLLLSQRDGSVSRDQVIGVFWPESDATRARNALRQALSFIRTCLGADAVVGVGAQGLAVAPRLSCDAVRFEAQLDTGRREDALRLYGGELLLGVHVAGAGGFEEWLDHRRLYLRQRAVRAAWELSAECEASGDGSGAAFWGKRALALSPFSEIEVQRLLKILHRVGDYAGVIRAFNGLQQAMLSEFGIGPSDETAQMAAAARAQLRAAQLPADAAVGARRSGGDRRVGQRRRSQKPWHGIERRTQPDRRSSERRSGKDRRAVN
ncbi:MAG: hypothetical protein H3C62_07090 [Gemmatimonadaceae bacterium]|nr:hypothetical protein [Gemmatimonadaceae bacterium]